MHGAVYVTIHFLERITITGDPLASRLALTLTTFTPPCRDDRRRWRSSLLFRFYLSFRQYGVETVQISEWYNRPYTAWIGSYENAQPMVVADATITVFVKDERLIQIALPNPCNSRYNSGYCEHYDTQARDACGPPLAPPPPWPVKRRRVRSGWPRLKKARVCVLVGQIYGGDGYAMFGYPQENRDAAEYARVLCIEMSNTSAVVQECQRFYDQAHRTILPRPCFFASSACSRATHCVASFSFAPAQPSPQWVASL